jgi:hypothetical protein
MLGETFIGTAKVEWSRDPVQVYAELRLLDELNDPDRERETVDHEHIRAGDMPEVSVTWTYGTARELKRGDGSGGAGIDGSVVDALEPAARARARRILELADRWHLSGMVAGCRHQPAEWRCTGRDGDHAGLEQGWPAIRARHGEYPYPRRGDACDVCERNRWDEPTDHCPETGYRFGTAWLVDVPPAEVLAELRELFGKPAGWWAPART